MTNLILSALQHPSYSNRIGDWCKYRLAFNGGRPFIDKYLQSYSAREDATEFAIRKGMTYCPAHAKAAILEIRNSVYERTDDIIRRNGPKTYMDAIAGVNGGVDNKNTDIDTFIGKYLLPDLLSIGKIGVYVDKAPVDGASINDTKSIRPYMYVYRAEEILSWTYNQQNKLVSLLLSETYEETDSITNLTCATKTRQKLFTLTPVGVNVSIQNEDNSWEPTKTLDLDCIPFVLFELDNSLLADVADYQIALLNLESSDLSYLIKSNFPFYTEQVNGLEEMANRTRSQAVIVSADGSTTGTQSGASEGQQSRGIGVGSSSGRAYPKGAERPGFINPSPDPIRVSMEKQEQLKSAIRQLVHLALTNIKPTRASADSKSKDEQGLEAGLSIIGMELAYGERQLASIWAQYEEVSNTTEIIYPDKYSLKTDADRLAEAKCLMEIYPTIPSKKYQREMAKRVTDVTIGHKADQKTMQEIHREIDAAKVICIAPEVIQMDHEAGLVSDKTASEARQYPPGESEQAAIDHAEKLSRVAIAQSSAAIAPIAGVTQDPAAAKDEKTLSQAPDVPGDKKKVRS